MYVCYLTFLHTPFKNAFQYSNTFWQKSYNTKVVSHLDSKVDGEYLLAYTTRSPLSLSQGILLLPHQIGQGLCAQHTENVLQVQACITPPSPTRESKDYKLMPLPIRESEDLDVLRDLEKLTTAIIRA